MATEEQKALAIIYTTLYHIIGDVLDNYKKAMSAKEDNDIFWVLAANLMAVNMQTSHIMTVVYVEHLKRFFSEPSHFSEPAGKESSITD